MSRIRFIAANWKMHDPPAGWDAPDSPYRPRTGADIVVFPALADITACRQAGLTTGAQYGRPEPDGSFTGDMSMKMLAERGCEFVLCGHSERRQHHHESDAMIAEQVAAALAADLTPVLCVGETADEREMGQAEETVKKQLKTVLETTSYQLPATSFVIAYEPVWAIGNGNTATAEDAQQMHASIRSLLPDAYKEEVRIVYGGSVKASNAGELIAQKDIDGFLVGGSSLKPAEFSEIIETTAAAR
jgi:triosephosphate isomerase (TIM)